MNISSAESLKISKRQTYIPSYKLLYSPNIFLYMAKMDCPRIKLQWLI